MSIVIHFTDFDDKVTAMFARKPCQVGKSDG